MLTEHTKIDHILGHKRNFASTGLKRIVIIQSMPSNHNGIKLEFNNRRIIGKPPNTEKINNTLLDNSWIKVDVSRKKFRKLL